jgi:hypothetical protein
MEIPVKKGRAAADHFESEELGSMALKAAQFSERSL